MTKFKLSFFLLTFLSLFFFSCEQENSDVINTEEESLDPEVNISSNPILSRASSDSTSSSLTFECFDIQLPFQVIGFDNTVYDIEDKDYFFELLDDTTARIIEFIFPLNINTQDGVTRVITTPEEMGIIFASCVPDEGWSEGLFPAFLLQDVSECLSLIFPLAVQTESGTTINVDNEFDLLLTISEQVVFFQFPLEVLNDNGNIVTTENNEELFEALLSCPQITWDDSTDFEGGGSFDLIGCYKLSFPILIKLTNGEVVTASNHNEYCSLIFSGDIQGFAYPLNLLNTDNIIVTAESAEELDELLADCYNDNNNGNDNGRPYNDVYALLIEGRMFENRPCYTINYPFYAMYTSRDGDTTSLVTLESESDIESFEWEDKLEIVYPVSVTPWITNGTLVLNNRDDLNELVNFCGQQRVALHELGLIYWSNFSIDGCYNIKFPLSFKYSDQFENYSEITIDSVEDFDFEYSVFTNYEFSYPITLIFNENNETIEVDSYEALFSAYFERCS